MIWTVASELARGRRGGTPEALLQLVTDVAEAITCGAFAGHITSGGFNCVAGGQVFGDPSFRLQAAMNHLLPARTTTRKQRMDIYGKHKARDLADHDHGLMVRRGPRLPATAGIC
jgi:hypothetical protein